MYEVARVQSEGENCGFDLENDCSQYSYQALQVDYKGFEALIYRAGRRWRRHFPLVQSSWFDLMIDLRRFVISLLDAVSQCRDSCWVGLVGR